MNSQIQELYRPLKREELARVIERKGNASRVPMLYHMWISPDIYGENAENVRALLAEYPYDMEIAPIYMPSVFQESCDSFAWVQKSPPPLEKLGFDNRIAIEDWENFDDILTGFPRWDDPRLLAEVPQHGEKYRLGQWWYCFFERLWSLRGMENALTDFYLYPEQVHRLFEWLTEFYCQIMERAKKEQEIDGIFVSDDIGTQTGPFFSTDIFREFFKPYYIRLFEKAHSLGLHFWLHTCGNVEAFLPDFAESGLDVLHPIQKGTMDARKVAEEWAGKLCIWAGVDVQYALPYGTETEVREEVRRLIDTFARPDGGFMLTFGNNSTPDWPLKNLRALLEESLTYGAVKNKAFFANT